MSKIIGWVLSFTKLGKVVEPVQQWLSGKKVYLGAAAVGIPALIAIVQGFSDGGIGYLAHVASTPEYKTLVAAWIAAAGRAAVTKAADPTKDPNNS